MRRPTGPDTRPTAPPPSPRPDPCALPQDHALGPALASLVRLYCAHFMPEVEPPTAAGGRAGR